MNIELNLGENIIENNVHNIKNLYLKHLFVLTKIKQQISDCCLGEYDLKIAPFQKKRMQERLKRIQELKRMGLKTKDNNESFYLNYLSPACLYCKQGFGTTIALSYVCNRNCFYCFQYRPQNVKRKIYRPINIDTNNAIQYLEENAFEKNIINLGISDGEPLLVLDKVLAAIKIVKKRKKTKSITRLYTNGDLLNEDILKKLKEVELDELRFGIKLEKLEILKKVIVAKKYIPRVLMEGPVFPESEKFMRKLLSELNRIKIFGINLLDLRCRYNIQMYKKRGYLFDYKQKRPFYEHWEHQGWPIYGSEKVIFNLLEFAIQKKFSISVHYCPVKQNIDVSYRNSRKMGAGIARQPYETVTEKGLLRKIIVCSPEHWAAMEDLRKQGVSEQEINISADNSRLQTHTKNLKYLNPDKYEIGILDTLRGGEEVDIKVMKSKNFNNLLMRNKIATARNSSYLTWTGESIAGIYFRKKSEKNEKATGVLDILNKGLKSLPDNDIIYAALSHIYFYLGKYKSAIKTANKAIKLGYRNGDIYLLLSSYYEKIEKYQKAIENLKKAEKINPAQAQINFILAKCYRRIGQIEQSNKEINKGSHKYRAVIKERENGDSGFY